MCSTSNWFEFAELLTTLIFSAIGLLAVYGWMRGDIGWLRRKSAPDAP